MRVDTRALFRMRQVSNAGSLLAGSASNGPHAANGIAAVFIACGQDVANVAESHAGITYAQLLDNGDYYWSVTLTSLIVASYGGGTGLPTSANAWKCLAATARARPTSSPRSSRQPCSPATSPSAARCCPTSGLRPTNSSGVTGPDDRARPAVVIARARPRRTPGQGTTRRLFSFTRLVCAGIDSITHEFIVVADTGGGFLEQRVQIADENRRPIRLGGWGGSTSSRRRNCRDRITVGHRCGRQQEQERQSWTTSRHPCLVAFARVAVRGTHIYLAVGPNAGCPSSLAVAKGSCVPGGGHSGMPNILKH